MNDIQHAVESIEHIKKAQQCLYDALKHLHNVHPEIVSTETTNLMGQIVVLASENHDYLSSSFNCERWIKQIKTEHLQIITVYKDNLSFNPMEFTIPTLVKLFINSDYYNKYLLGGAFGALFIASLPGTLDNDEISNNNIIEVFEEEFKRQVPNPPFKV